MHQDDRDETARKECRIVTFDAKELITQIGLLFSDEPRSTLHWMDDEIVETNVVLRTARVSQNRSNALLDQIACCLEPDEGAVFSDGGAVTKWLVYVDFSEYIKYRDPDDPDRSLNIAVEHLVDDGFTIDDLASDEPRRWHYSIFDKSSSQSRNQIVSFVADAGFSTSGEGPVRILDNLNERLCLGIDFSAPSDECPVEWSKYFAYRGLYLSVGNRIDHKDLLLDENTVLVLGPITGQIAESETVPNGVLRIEDSEEPGGGGWDFKKDNEENNGFRSRSKLFDGEGLVSPRYAGLIRESLGKGAASSFQIRMPFAKGVLHEVDFHGFLKDELGMVPGMKIKDAFGEIRDLDKVQIILSAEMLKCLKWLGRRSSEEDPMRYYFGKFGEFDHALYVTQTDSGLDKSGVTNLNGQFLSTLCMSREVFDGFVRERMAAAIGALDDPDAARRLLVRERLYQDIRADADDEEPEEEPTDTLLSDYPFGAPLGTDGARDLGDAVLWDDPEQDGEGAGDGDIEDAFLTWRRALKRSRRFIDDPFIRDEISYIASSKLLKCAIGNLDAEGELLYLSHDLMHLLVEIAGNVLETSLGTCGFGRGNLGKIAEACIKPGEFYASSVEKKGIGQDSYFGVLRNPHLSRSEQCALRRRGRPNGPGGSKDLYSAYFGHLDGVAMVACDSAVPVVLGGADFDGDLVRVLWEERIVEAILKGAYIEGDPRCGRRYPVVDMEGPKREGAGEPDSIQAIGSHISFKQMIRTFSNHIGLLSNSAMRKARSAYGAKAGAPRDDCPIPEEDACAIYSVATGMEIDAVKTGEDLKGMIKNISVRPGGTEEDKLGFIEFKKKGYKKLSGRQDDILSGSYHVDGPKRKGILSLLELAKGKQVQLEAFAYEKPDEEGAVGSGEIHAANIDRLPWLMLDEIRENDGLIARSKKRRATKDAILFNFEEDPEWSACLDEGKLGRIEEMLLAYRLLYAEKGFFERKRAGFERRNDFAKACRIARSSPSIGKGERADAEVRLRGALSEMGDYFVRNRNDSSRSPEAALKRIRSESWAFRPPGKRKVAFQKILPGFEPSESFRELAVANNQSSWYMLLFYLLRAAERNEKLNEEFVPRKRGALVDANEGLYRDLGEMTKRGMKERVTRADWNNDVAAEIRSRIREVLGSEFTTELVKYLHYFRVRSPEDSRYFYGRANEKRLFWSLLEWDEVKGYIDEDAPIEIIV